jgi:hypothetical protein
MLSSLPDLQKEKGLPHPSRKKKTLKLKRESTSLPREACLRFLAECRAQKTTGEILRPPESTAGSG